MPAQTMRSLSLTPEPTASIDAAVSSGPYRSASEILRGALRLMEEDRREAARVAAPAPGSPHAR